MSNKKLRHSRYNIEIKKSDNGDTLMFNALSSSICELGKSGMNIYKSIENLDINKVKDSETTYIINELESNGFLVDTEFDEYKFYENLFLRNKFINDYLHITVAVTLDCNMACPYCYETREDIYMNTETADDLIKFVQICRNYNNTKGLHIHWMGGEPLLNLDIIEYISKKLIEYCDNNKVMYGASISTNGVLLNKDIAHRLNNYKVISTQITVDGTKEIHNKRRILINEEDSYSIILNNILECKDIINIKVRTNIDKENIDNVYDLIDQLNKYNIEYFYKPVINPDIELYNKIEGNTNFFTEEEYSEVEIDLETYINKKFNKSINDLYPSLKISPCDGDRETTLKIDPNGLIYRCTALFSQPEMSVGNIVHGITNSCLQTKWTGIEIHQKCKECEKLPICGGGCPLKRIKNPHIDIECPHNSFNLDKKIEMMLKNK